jgi:hypothetical protein
MILPLRTRLSDDSTMPYDWCTGEVGWAGGVGVGDKVGTEAVGEFCCGECVVGGWRRCGGDVRRREAEGVVGKWA